MADQTTDLTDRQHKGLYALYIAAQRLDRQTATTREVYTFGGEVEGVELLKSKQDTSALLATFREQGWAETADDDGQEYYNRLTDAGIDLLERLGVPADVETAAN